MAINFDDEELFWEMMYGDEGDGGETTPTKTTATEEEKVPSPEEKVRAALIANEAMKQEEANAEKLWNLQGRPTVTPEMAASFRNEPKQYGQVMPTSRGFMYVGAPPPANEPNAGYDRMKSMGMIQPPSERRLQPTDIAWTPAYDQFAAQQDIKAAVARGVPLAEALAQNPAALAGLRAGAQESLARSAAPPRLSAATVKRPINISGRGYIWDPVAGSLTPGTPEPAPKTAAQLSPEGAARLLRSATPEELNAKLPNGETARQYLEKIVYGGMAGSKEAVAPPPGTTTTSTGTGPKPAPRIGEVIKGYRFKGGNPNDRNSWEKM